MVRRSPLGVSISRSNQALCEIVHWDWMLGCIVPRACSSKICCWSSGTSRCCTAKVVIPIASSRDICITRSTPLFQSRMIWFSSTKMFPSHDCSKKCLYGRRSCTCASSSAMRWRRAAFSCCNVCRVVWFIGIPSAFLTGGLVLVVFLVGLDNTIIGRFLLQKRLL